MPTAANTSASTPVRLKRTLTLFPVVMIGLAYIQPMTLFDTFGIVSGFTNGHVITAYIFALLAIMFTALSYGQLVRRFPLSGSAYSYAQKAISPFVGYMVGWSSLLDYLFMPMINILLAKIYFEALFPGLPSSLFVILLVGLMTFANLRGIRTVANFNTFVVILQVLVLIFVVTMLITQITQKEGASALVSHHAFWSEGTHMGLIVTGASILCFSFLGFDGLSALSEETQDAARIVPKAIFITVLIGGGIFIFVTYFVQLYFPNVSYFSDPNASQPEIMIAIAGRTFQFGILMFSTITVFASGMAAHAGVSRLMYVMGRDGVFSHRIFGHLHSRLRTPVFNIIIVGLIALLAIKIDLVLATALINFGALVAFTFVNLSVIAQYWLREKCRYSLKDNIHYLLLPLCGALTVGGMWINLERSSMILGSIWAVIGLGYLLWITRFFNRAIPQFDEKKI